MVNEHDEVVVGVGNGEGVEGVRFGGRWLLVWGPCLMSSLINIKNG